MFGIGMGEAVLIAIVALLFLKPEDVPGLLREIGKLIAQAQRWWDVVLDEINSWDIKH